MRRLLVLLIACHDPTTYDVTTGPRDWTAHPAIAQATSNGTIYAVSDVHGGFQRLVTLLQTNNVIDGAQHWHAGGATLVVTGDMFDKGPDGLEVIGLFQALQAEGHVIVTLGNHEAEFFADPRNSKATASDGIDRELADPIALASGSDPRGVWLRNLPSAAKVDDWFFSHAGNTKGRTVAELEAALETDDFTSSELVGSDSILESRDWYTNAATVTAAAQALGVAHFVFGHTPSALGPRGAIAVAQDGALFRIDCGMSPDVDDSQGALFRIDCGMSPDVDDSQGALFQFSNGIATQLAADGSITELWRAR